VLITLLEEFCQLPAGGEMRVELVSVAINWHAVFLAPDGILLERDTVDRNTVIFQLCMA
jgi:hypothetical protein